MYSPVKIGLLTVALVWFLFTFHETFKGMVNIGEYAYFTGPASTWVLVTDVSGGIGLIARTVAGVVAVAAIALYLAKKGFPSSTVRKILQWVLVAEIIYWLALLISGIWGVLPMDIGGLGNSQGGLNFNMGFLIETGIPCLVSSILIPVILVKLILELRPNKPLKGAIKWGLIAGVAYIFIFWLDNSSNWFYTVMYTEKGWACLTSYPENLLSFALTTIGLLALTGYAAYFARRSVGTETIENLNLRIIGAIIVLVGLYFLWNYLTWIYFGNDQLWSQWYAWFLGHNMDLWALALPILGLPLLFKARPSQKKNA
jgi:hypothetical protein